MAKLHFPYFKVSLIGNFATYNVSNHSNIAIVFHPLVITIKVVPTFALILSYQDSQLPHLWQHYHQVS